MKRLRVLGIGSPFGDDRLGWEAVDRLRQESFDILGWSIEFDTLDRPGPGLLEEIAGGDAVILIDAVHSGATPGSVFVVDREQLALHGYRCSSHGLGVAETLALGDKLGALPPRMGLIGIEVGGLKAGRLAAVFNVQVRLLLDLPG